MTLPDQSTTSSYNGDWSGWARDSSQDPIAAESSAFNYMRRRIVFSLCSTAVKIKPRASGRPNMSFEKEVKENWETERVMGC